MKLYYGNYVGIVMQNNDPDRAGKVKVFVPHITATVYKKWVQDKSNKKFKFLGSNINSVLTQTLSGNPNQIEYINNIVEELKIILPWASCAAPLSNENVSGRYNNYHNVSNISDSNFFETFSQSTSSAPDTPGKPAAFYETLDNKLSDAFTNASDNINRPNPLSYEYVPSSYSNRAKGSFGIPAVGSHIWVFFREGNPTSPVYFATVYGQTDWQGIYEAYDNPGIDYPGSFENKNAAYTTADVNVETYRSKYVINQKGGAIEIVNTDLKESLKLTHFSGSFREMNNQANIELATKQDQKLVLGDQYETVRGFKNVYVGKSLDENILRDKYTKVGTLSADLFKQWKEVFAPIQDVKQLFEVQRAYPSNILDANGNIVIKRNSLLQTRSGQFAPHPVTSTGITYASLNNDSSGKSIKGALTLHTVANSKSNSPALLKVPELPASKAPLPSISNYQQESGVVWGPQGPGYSTSTEGGNWVVDSRKDQIKTLIESNMQALTDIEKNLGIGGSEINQISKHKIETIGMEVNNYGSFRLDKIGKMLTNEVLVDDFGTYVNKKESPLLEYVHVQDLPGGNYTLNVCNRFNVLVGAGGVNIKSLGSTNITGTITNIVGEQVNIASENEINIDAPTINISAEILRLRNKRQRQIYIEDGLGVNKNVIIGGGLSVEGEVYLQHITAPAEYQATEVTKLFGKLLKGMQFQAQMVLPGVQSGSGATTTATVTLTQDSIDNMVQCYDHSHIFKNLPLTLLDRNVQVRQAAKNLNSSKERSVATKRVHQKK